MRTTEATIEELMELLAPAGDVRARKMFGEYALYCDEKVVALACRDELFVKDTPEGRAFAPELELEPACLPRRETRDACTARQVARWYMASRIGANNSQCASG